MSTSILEKIFWKVKFAIHELTPGRPPDLFTVAKQLLPEASVCLDCGANRGTTTERMLKLWPEARIFSFDAGAPQIEGLKQRFAKESRVQIRRALLSDKEETVSFYASTVNPAVSSIYMRTDRVGNQAATEMTSELLENILDELEVKPNFVKVDAEGHDPKVLRGMGRYLADVNVILAEVGFVELHEGQEPSWHELVALLHPTHALQSLHVNFSKDGLAQSGDMLFQKRPA